VAHEVVYVTRDLTPLGDQRLLSQLAPGVFELIRELLLPNESARHGPWEGDAHDPDGDGHLRRVLHHGHQHRRGRSEQAERHGAPERRRPAPDDEGEDRCLEHERLELSRALRDDHRDDHGDGEDQEGRLGHPGPDVEGGDGHACEQEVGRGRGLRHHGNEGDRQRDDRDQAAKRGGLEPALA
jgi:hypothetical protein